MNNVFLVTRPNYDLATNYLFQWSLLVISEAKKKKFNVLDLSRNKANKQTFLSYVRKHNPTLIFINGHGSANSITGQDDEVLVHISEDNEILRDKIMYVRSCEVAKLLGRKCIQEGTMAFIGYKEKFLLGYSERKISKPLDDKVAMLFLKPSNLVPISILKGNTVKNAYIKSQKEMARSLSLMLSTKASDEQRTAAPYLYSNKVNQRILGNYEARIE